MTMDLDSLIEHLKVRLDFAIEERKYGNIEVLSEAIKRLEELKELREQILKLSVEYDLLKRKD